MGREEAERNGGLVKSTPNSSFQSTRNPLLKYTFQPKITPEIKAKALADSKLALAMSGTPKMLALYRKPKGGMTIWARVGTAVAVLPGVMSAIYTWGFATNYHFMLLV